MLGLPNMAFENVINTLKTTPKILNTTEDHSTRVQNKERRHHVQGYGSSLSTEPTHLPNLPY